MTKEQLANYLVNISGTSLITEERNRQISEKGYNWRNDDQYTFGQLTKAAEAYLSLGFPKSQIQKSGYIPFIWPWRSEFFKPSLDDSIEGRIKELVKAGALIAAEIDRLNRAKVRMNYGKGAIDNE